MNALKSILVLCIVSFALHSCDDEKEATQPQPTVTSLNISEGEVGTNVIITGTNFGTVVNDIEVTFNNTEASVASVSNTTINTTVPVGATSGIVKIKVKSLEANGPSFTVLVPVMVSVLPLSITINENPINGGLLGTISATSNQGNLSYSLTSQSVSGAMAINATSGILTVANVAAFDFELNPTITGVVSVSNESETATANITITLNNVADVALDNFSAIVAENIANSSVIGTMNVTTGSGTFAITSQTPSGAFQINSTTGQLTVLNSSVFNFELNPTISATASLTGGSEVKTATVTINLTNITEVNISDFSLSIAENPSINAVIGTAAPFASIPDGVGGSIQYALISQSPSSALAINASTGQLSVATGAAFDFETNPNITGTYSVSNLSETRTASFTISVTDVFEAPVPTVTVIAMAGSEANSGCADGSGTNVRFTTPHLGQAKQAGGNPLELYIADKDCGARKVIITGTGTNSVTATTLQANNAPATFEYVDMINFGTYSLITYRGIGYGQGNILKVPANGSAVTNFSSNTLNAPSGLASDNNGNVYVANLRTIQKFSSTGGNELSTYGDGQLGSVDGAATTAQFRLISDVQVNTDGDILVADLYAVRKINAATGAVSTLAGNGNDQNDFNGTLTTSRFGTINSIGVLPNGNIVVADSGNNKIKLVDIQNNQVVTLVAFASAQPQGIIVVNNETFYFTRTNSTAIYKATISTNTCTNCR